MVNMVEVLFWVGLGLLSLAYIFRYLEQWDEPEKYPWWGLLIANAAVLPLVLFVFAGVISRAFMDGLSPWWVAVLVIMLRSGSGRQFTWTKPMSKEN